MNSKLDKINAEIKATWKNCLRFTFLVTVLVVLAFFMFDFKHQRKLEKYQKEYESTTWREAEAVLDHNYYHQEREENDDGYEYVDYYDWYFTYQGLDGNSYTYVEKNNSFEGTESHTTTIYVDEYDDSHSLEIQDFSKDSYYVSFAKKVTLLIVAVMVLGPYILTFIVLYIRKFIAVQMLKRTSEW